jgi:flagellar motility protein MotE (MotC chaperone)
MIRLARDFRLIPIVLLATISLFALKVSGLVFDGGYTLAERMQSRDKTATQVTTADSVVDYPKFAVTDNQLMTNVPARRRQSWAQEMFNYNDAAKSDVTGSVAEAPDKSSSPPLKTSEKPPDPPKLDVGGTAYPLEQGKIASPGERAVLERLQDRREALDTRSRDLEMRENLLKLAEKRLEAKVMELKDAEARVNTAMGNRDAAEAQRFKGIVSMYENMKAKDAAKIFDRLDIRLATEVAFQIAPRRMSDILALMSPEAAERLTVELANRNADKSQTAPDLPKIDGRPGGS